MLLGSGRKIESAILTRIARRTDVILTSELDIDKVNFELLLGLYTNEQWGTTSGSDDLIREVPALEDKGKRPLKLQQYSLDERRECNAFIRLRVVDKLCEDSDSLGVSLALKLVTAFLEYEPELARVGHNTVVHDGELVGGVAADRVTVDRRGSAVGSPASVGDGDLGEESLARVDIRFCNVLAQACDLSDLLEKKDFSSFVTVDTNACRVVSTIFKALETVAKDVANGFAILFNQKVAVGEDAAHDAQ